MISERDIAEKFSVIWKQNFPLLTSNYIRVFNETQIEKINRFPVLTNEKVRYDLISEAAFNLSEIVNVTNGTAKEILSNSQKLNELIAGTANVIWKSGKYSNDELIINEFEKDEIFKICNNIIEFINTVKKESIYFKPCLKGYSFIPDLVADILIDDTLYEIKTVNRNFKSSDLKQLFLYLALKQTSKSENWKYAGLYNPRKGTYCKFSVKKIVYDLSGGKTPNEAFENLLESLIRDIQIDSKF